MPHYYPSYMSDEETGFKRLKNLLKMADLWIKVPEFCHRILGLQEPNCPYRQRIENLCVMHYAVKQKIRNCL